MHHPTTIRNMSITELMHYGYIKCEQHPDDREFQNDLFECAEVSDKYYSDDFVTRIVYEDEEMRGDALRGALYSVGSDANDIKNILEEDVIEEDETKRLQRISKHIENILNTADDYVEIP